MRVLLLSTNRTVQEMIALALRDVPGVELVLARGIDEVGEDVLDAMLIDDAMPLYRESLALVERIGVPKTVLLHQEGVEDDRAFDYRIKKPFLPSEIREAIEQFVLEEIEEEEMVMAMEDEPESGKFDQNSPQKKKKKKSKYKREKKATYQTEAEVLNLDEIETIKALLEEDGLEIVHEEELAEKMLKEHKEGDGDEHEALIHALRTMKPRKIRKLLKGAHVRIDITFPEDDT